MWKFDVKDKIVEPLFVMPIIVIWYLFKSTGLIALGDWVRFDPCFEGDIGTFLGGDTDPWYLFC